MQATSISSVIPTRDRAHMVGDAIHSLLNQSRPPDEIIIVDDGSVDSTQNMLARYGEILKIVTTDGVGPAGARNAGLAICTGTYVHFLDSDDILLPDALSILSEILEATGAPAAWGQSVVEVLPGGRLQHEKWPIQPAQLVTVCASLFRRLDLADVGGFDERLRFGEDTELMTRIMAAGWMVEKTPGLVLQHRRHSGNMTLDMPAAARAWFDIARIVADRSRRDSA